MLLSGRTTKENVWYSIRIMSLAYTIMFLFVVFYRLHVFRNRHVLNCAWQRMHACVRLPSVAFFPALSTGRMFSRLWHLLHVFLRLPRDAWFPAFGTGQINLFARLPPASLFSGALQRMHVFPRLAFHAVSLHCNRVFVLKSGDTFCFALLSSITVSHVGRSPILQGFFKRKTGNVRISFPNAYSYFCMCSKHHRNCSSKHRS